MVELSGEGCCGVLCSGMKILSCGQLTKWKLPSRVTCENCWARTFSLLRLLECYLERDGMPLFLVNDDLTHDDCEAGPFAC